MEKLINDRKLWIKRLLIASVIVLLCRLFLFFLDQNIKTLDITNLEKVTIYTNTLIGLSLLLLMIFPKELSFKEWLCFHSVSILIGLLIVIYDGLFFIRIDSNLSVYKIFSTVGIFTFVMGFLYLMPRKIRSGVTVFFLIVLPIYYVAQDIYFGIFERFFSFKEVVTLQEGIESSEGMINFSLFHYTYFFMMIVSIVVYQIIKRRLHPHFLEFHLSKSSFVQALAPTGIILALVNINTSIPPKTARLHLSDHYLYFSVFDNTSFVDRFGVTHYLVRDIADSIVPEYVNPDDYKKIDEYFENNLKEHASNEYTGIFEGKNLIFLVAESFDGIAMDDILTPNIMRLKREGIYFDNHYVPVYPRTTCDTEFIYNTGLIPSIKDGPTCYKYNRNSYSQSLPMLFKEKGYLTQAFHNNYKEFYTRQLVYKGYGYDALFGEHELGLIHDKTTDEKRYDSIFFEKGKDLMLPEDSPFMSFILTLSGHSPYETVNLAVDKHLSTVKERFNEEDIDDAILKYIAAQIEVDIVVGQLMDELTERGLLEDTVIIFTSDHYPYTLNKKAYENYTGIKESHLKMKSPLIIWGADLEPQTIERLTSSFDLLPTIGNLFNLDINYTYYVGHDVFDQHHEEIVLFKDYAWFDGVNYVKDGKLESGSMSKEEVERISRKVDEMYQIGRKILQVDYFKREDDDL